jgi:hypothetical protein
MKHGPGFSKEWKKLPPMPFLLDSREKGKENV